MDLPLRAPYELGGLMLAEIDATHRYLGRIEPGGAKPRILRPTVERNRAGEGLNRQNGKTGCCRLVMNRVGVRGLENEPVEADRKAHDLRADRAVAGNAEQLQIVGREHCEVVDR